MAIKNYYLPINNKTLIYLHIIKIKKFKIKEFKIKKSNYLYFTNYIYKYYYLYNNNSINYKTFLDLIDFNLLNLNTEIVANVSVQGDWLLLNYLKQLSFYYLGVELEWMFVNLKNSLKNSFFKKFWYIIYRKKFFKLFYGKKKKTLSWFLQLYKLKDTQGLINLIQIKLYNAKLKRHKRIFYLVGFFFRILFLLKKKSSLQGCSLFFKGKLGKKGSVRKSKFFVKMGVVSLTNKSLRINYKTYVIVTITGVIGCGISIFYK